MGIVKITIERAIIPASRGLSGHVIATNKPVLIGKIEDVNDIDIVQTGPPPHMKSVLAVPIQMEGKAFGVLAAQSYTANAYSPGDQQVLSTLANQVAIAIDNARLFDEARRRAAHLEALNTIVANAASATNLKNLLETALNLTMQTLGVGLGGICIGEQCVTWKLPLEAMHPLALLCIEADNLFESPVCVKDWQTEQESDLVEGLAEVMAKVLEQARLVAPQKKFRSLSPPTRMAKSKTRLGASQKKSKAAPRPKRSR